MTQNVPNLNRLILYDGVNLCGDNNVDTLGGVLEGVSNTQESQSTCTQSGLMVMRDTNCLHRLQMGRSLIKG